MEALWSLSFEEVKTVAYFEDKIASLVDLHLLDEAENIIHENRFIIKLADLELFNFFIERTEEFTILLNKHLRRAVNEYNYPINVNRLRIIYDSSYFINKKLRDLEATTINKTVSFDGVVVGENPIKAYMKTAFVLCKKCYKKDRVAVINNKIESPMCTECKLQMAIQDDLCEYGEVKDVIIREPFEESIDRQPVEYVCKIKDSLINEVYIGKKVRAIGVRRVIKQKANEHPFEIMIYGVEDLGDPKDVFPTPEEIKFFTQESRKEGFEDNLVGSFAPDIFCTPQSILWDIKYSILLFLSIGNNVEGKRQAINMFLCGDPGVSKSTLMKYAISISPHSMYVSGNGASEAGLTAIIEKQADGRFVAKAGILPLCDGGFAGVDEMNLMTPEHQNALQEAMENQFVTKAKAVSIQFPARCGVIGGANPIYGRYDQDRTVIENVQLAIPLLNRFDIKWNLIDDRDPKTDQAISNHILKYTSDPTKIINDAPFSKVGLIKYMNFVREQKPELTDLSQKKIIDFVLKIRGLTKDKHSMPVDRRIIESLARLCIARAKLLLKKQVDESDVEYISKLYLRSLESFGIDTKTDLVQNKFFDTRELGQEQTFWKIYSECMDNDQSVDMVNVIEKLACTKHFDEFKAKSFFEKQIARRKLYELKSGRWKKVD